MEGSGLGYAGLILARAQLQRTPVLLVASRTRILDAQLRAIAAKAITTVKGQSSRAPCSSSGP